MIILDKIKSHFHHVTKFESNAKNLIDFGISRPNKPFNSLTGWIDVDYYLVLFLDIITIGIYASLSKTTREIVYSNSNYGWLLAYKRSTGNSGLKGLVRWSLDNIKIHIHRNELFLWYYQLLRNHDMHSKKSAIVLHQDNYEIVGCCTRCIENDVTFFLPESIAHIASVYGLPELLSALQDKLDYRVTDEYSRMIEAAANGHVNILNWFLYNGYVVSYAKQIFWSAAGNRHINVLKWLENIYQSDLCEITQIGNDIEFMIKYSATTTTPTITPTITLAGQSETAVDALEVLQWIIKLFKKANVQININIGAIVEAIRIGRLDIVKLLDKYSRFRFQNLRLHTAVECGNYDITKYIVETQEMGEDPLQLVSAIELAAVKGHQQIYHYLLKFKPDPVKFSEKNISRAAENGSVFMLEMFEQEIQSNHKLIKSIIRKAAKNGQLTVLVWMHQHMKRNCKFKAAFLSALQNGQIEVLTWILSVDKIKFDKSFVTIAVRENKLQVLEWLDNNYPNLSYNSEPISIAIENQKIKILYWFRKKWFINPSKYPFLFKMRKEFPDESLEWLETTIKFYPSIIGRNKKMLLAVINGQENN